MVGNCLIVLILLGIFKYGQGFSSGDWIEIDGCYTLNGNLGIVNRIDMPSNEAGECLHFCATDTVAVQGSTCFCLNSEPSRAIESHCNITCSGDQRLKCGGVATVSVYKARQNIPVEWRSLNGTECLTNRVSTENIKYGVFEPENCSAGYDYYCFDEIKYQVVDCHREAKGVKRTWSEALADCRLGSSLHSHLWPANDGCGKEHVSQEKFWVAVYQWTKVITTPSTTTITSTSTTTMTSTSSTTMTSPTTTTTRSTSTTITTSPLTSSSKTTKRSTSTTTKTPTSATTTSPTIPSTMSLSPTSASSSVLTTTTSTTLKYNNSAITSSFTSTTATTFSPENGNSSEATTTKQVQNLSAKEARNFKIDAPNIGIGLGIGILLGCLISITIAYCRKSDRHRGTSSSAINGTNVELGSTKYYQNVNISTASKQEVKTGGKSDTSQDHHNAVENDDAVFSANL